MSLRRRGSPSKRREEKEAAAVAVAAEEEPELEMEEEEPEDFDVPPEEEAPEETVEDPRALFERRGPGRRPRKVQPTPGDLSYTLRENLKRLKNLLKLPKARRWVFTEFFYSDIDRELFLGENEFSQCLREAFPNLKTRNLTRLQWSEIRRLIGKPRRCSQAFFNEERASLDAKRSKVRDIHNGAVLVLDTDLIDIPSRIPEPLIVGHKVYARVRNPKDGIYSGHVDAVLPDSYRVLFDKEIVPPTIIRDFEVMSETPGALVSLNYFLEKNKASAPICARAQAAPTAQSWLSPSKVLSSDTSPLMKYDPVMSAAMGGKMAASPSRALGQRALGPGIAPSTGVALPGSKGDERVGNFPLRLLVMLVKLNKLMEIKRSLVRQITELNAEAERQNIITNRYPREFQEKYAQIVVDLEALNKQLGAYLNGIAEYENSLVPHLSEVTLTSRPETLRKLCHSHALQIVRQANVGLSVGNSRIIQLITALTALLLQVRSLGQQSSNALELNTLSEALGQLRLQIHPCNLRSFQDNVEVHMKQIHGSMLQQTEAPSAFAGVL